jgi:hypothetical protein
MEGMFHAMVTSMDSMCGLEGLRFPASHGPLERLGESNSTHVGNTDVLSRMMYATL